MVKDFIDFVRKHSVIGMAVGIILGGAVTKMVNAIIQDLINPILGTIVGGGKGLESYAFTIPHTKVTFGYGDLISELITFLSILLVVYLLFVKSPLNKLDKKAE